MNPLANPYVRIGVGAVLSSYVAPKIVNHFVRAELNEVDATINQATNIGITAGITVLFFVGVGMLIGKPVAAAVAA